MSERAPADPEESSATFGAGRTFDWREEPAAGSERMSPTQLRERSQDSIRAEWEAATQRLPPEASTTWERGALYVRESAADSLVGSSPAVQARLSLAMLAQQRIYVPWDAVAFENLSGTDLESRTKLTELLERALAGEFKTIGAYVPSRFFRNMEESMAVKRQLRLAGARLMWAGKAEMDPRQPASWAFERQMEMADEMHSRMTSFHVGNALEQRSADGFPAGKLQEIWRVAERGPTLRGERPGPALRYELNEPLASVVREGADRYLNGSSALDLAVWCKDTEVQGRTPKGRIMDQYWWRRILANPKIAGYHRPTQYQGFRPGKESPLRSPKIRLEDLRPCRLPALISLETWQRIQDLAHVRAHNLKWRPTYQLQLLTSVARHTACGHSLTVSRHKENGEFWMVCRARGLQERGHNHEFRASDAARQLDALMGSITFEDETLLEAVAAELVRMQAVAEPGPPPEPPELAHLRTALAAVEETTFPELHAQIRAQMAEVERRALVDYQQPKPVSRFRVSVDQLKNWSKIWSRASLREKNELLRAAGVRVWIEPTPPKPGRKRHSRCDCVRSRIVRIEADLPEFALALATALGQNSALGSLGTHNAPNAGLSPGLVVLPPEFADLLARAGVEATPVERAA